ncbi:glycosyltransferase family 4 protein [Ningiella sp. W23]|uniref:glycosyltransferase family 4 protein n=1 Tax=Ningiella sp. W23 TaxID=3023715 RepID=UPI003757378C
MQKRINFVCMQSDNKVSGGYIYNDYVLGGLSKLGYEVVHHDAKSYLADAGQNAHSCASEHVIIDSIELNALLLALSSDANEVQLSRPIILCHLPPELQLDAQSAKLSNSDKSCECTHECMSMQQLIQRSMLVTTGTACTQYMQAEYQLKDAQLEMVMPGLPAQWKRKSQYSNAPKRLLVVANLIPNKGYELLIEALSQIKHLDWTLDFYGDCDFSPEHAEKIFTSMQQSGLRRRIEYGGTVTQSELNEAMIKADLLIQLSPFEPFSMVSLEAVSSGLPMLSAKTGEMDYFRQSGHVRYLDTLDSREVAKVLSELINDTEKYSELCQSHDTALRSWNEVTLEFHRLLLNLETTHTLQCAGNS